MFVFYSELPQIRIFSFPGHVENIRLLNDHFSRNLTSFGIFDNTYAGRTLFQVSSAMNRMTVKSEAGVAASLALVKMCINLLATPTLEDITNVSQYTHIHICTSQYVVP